MSDDPRDAHRTFARLPLATQSEIAKQDPAYPRTDAARPNESLFPDWRVRLARNLARRSDGRFEGDVALKLLNLAVFDRAGEERFRREGTLLSRLSHPNIARLFDAGRQAGLRTLREAAIEKVLSGTTTVSEMVRVTGK